MPYIFVLFYMQIDPFTYQETAEISNPHAAFEKVSSMGRYIFSIPESPNPAEDAVYILSCDELAGFDSANFHHKSPLNNVKESQPILVTLFYSTTTAYYYLI